MISTSQPGISGFWPWIGGGASSQTRRITSTVDSPAKAGRPMHMAYSTLPRLNRSARRSIFSPRACSGAMYCGVPAKRAVLGQPGVVDGAGEAEVGQLHPRQVILQHDVARLDVAVDQPLARARRPGRRRPASRSGGSRGPPGVRVRRFDAGATSR